MPQDPILSPPSVLYVCVATEGDYETFRTKVTILLHHCPDGMVSAEILKVLTTIRKAIFTVFLAGTRNGNARRRMRKPVLVRFSVQCLRLKGSES